MEWIVVGGFGVLIIAVVGLIKAQSKRFEATMNARTLDLDGLRKQNDDLGKQNAALQKRIEGLKRLAEQNRDGVQDAKDRVAMVRKVVEGEQSRLIETREVLEYTRSAPNPGSALLLREARRNTRYESAERLLLLVTLHRSASTTLFDIFRSHPDVFIESTASLWNDAGLRGRRYPLDLSNGASGEIAIEAEPGVGALIPDTPGGTRHPHVAIEKAHPQFFDFDVAAFVAHLRSLESSAPYEISMVYGIRQPLEAMWSMAEYQQRNPRWYQFLGPDSIPDFIERSIGAIEELSRLVPGLIVDYEDTIEGAQPFRTAFCGLTTPALDGQLFDEARLLFARESRAKSQHGRFVGEGTGVRDRVGPGGVWEGCSDVIDRAEKIYEQLRRRRGHGEGPAET